MNIIGTRKKYLFSEISYLPINKIFIRFDISFDIFLILSSYD